MDTPKKPKCKHLLSLTPLRGLAESYYTVPQVLADILNGLGLLSGVNVVIKSPDAASLSHVIQWARKTGDYGVLSHPDLSVLALTYMLHKEGEAKGAIQPADPEDESGITLEDEYAREEEDESEPLDVEIHRVQDGDQPSSQQAMENISEDSVFEDPTDEDDGEGEWITPDNVHIHKSKALGLLPSEANNANDEEIWAGCMTVDFAMQNVLLQMGLNLVGLAGKRIEKIKTWVLRCHACYKLCKDNTKKFCPSCGNPTLIRASVTVAKPGADPKAPALQVHLKKNFQYRLRGTKYPIPAPKPGSAKTGSWQRLDPARGSGGKRKGGSQDTEGMAKKTASSTMGVLSSWMDPDWVPEMVTTGIGGKGRNPRSGDELPQFGYGRRNPNERRRK
ncbi:Nin one binding Zn-ribbon like-domain-containing protein [Amanita rubescens]|nr:Nin one binding Zn-ribbon like-domain-containing protein [Amanita rubescens]